MKLPVYPQGERDIIDKDGKFVCFANTTADRDSIVKAVNRCDELVKSIEYALGCGIMTETVCKKFKQALKEAEKQ